uniref:ribulose-phosphate 3-epimerase n=1 Tax=Canis lupus familiaris TaxID=9615 RepID=A0A8C0TLA9_CANLF
MTGPSILNNIGLQANYLHPDVTDRWAFCSHHLWSPCDREFLKAARPGFFGMQRTVSRLEHWVRPVAAVVANQYTFHLEDTKTPGALIKDTWENEMKVRLAIKLGATVEYSATWANQIDTSSVMPVEPEFGGQQHMEDTVSKVQQCANMTLSGSAIMRSESPRSVINLLGYICSETFSSSVKSQGA